MPFIYMLFLVLTLLVASVYDLHAQVSPDGPAAVRHFSKVVLTDEVTDPNELAIAPDGRVFVAERFGPIKMWDPETGETRMVGFIPVRMTIEDGLMGLTLDPNFDENGWIYVYYAPANGGPQRVARLTYVDGAVNMGSEKVLLEIHTQQRECCHSAGSLTFGPDGNLFLSTGDNTNPYPLGGSSIDERNRFGDAQRTSANTNDLRGKILRITPQPDGTYTIPEGNLFEGDALHRPEIYVMGNRNPYRISVDPQTGWLYWGDVGIGNPPSEERGPWGWEEFNRAKQPGFYGWPYFAGPNDAYRDFDYVTETPGEFFDPLAPLNDSPHNTGARQLPPAQPALIWYTYGPSEQFPELGAGGMSAMGGPIYRYNAETASPHALPEKYDGSWIIYEWMRNWVQEVRFEASGDSISIHPFMEGLTWARPNDIEIGPDGRLYVIEWGESFWGSNPDAQVVRVDYYEGGVPAGAGAAAADSVAGAAAAVDSGGLRVEGDSSVPGGNLDEGAGAGPRIVWPPDGGFFEYGEPIQLEIEGDTEGAVVQAFSGHDTHAHPFDPLPGDADEVLIWRRFLHVPDLYYQDEFAEIEVRTESGGSDRVRLHPHTVQAEHAAARAGVERKTYGEHPAEYDFAATALTVLEIADGGHAMYQPINLAEIDSVRVRVKASGPAALELRLDAPDGPLLARLDAQAGSSVPAEAVAGQRTLLPDDVALAKVPENTRAAYRGWRDVSVAISDPGGTRQLFVVPSATVEIDWMRFIGSGAPTP